MRQLRSENGVVTRCLDEPDHENGSACHEYEVVTDDGRTLLTVEFQHGPVGEQGINGVQHRELLAILEDRLRGFQFGEYASDLNGHALAGVQMAISSDAERTARRSLAGVEGFSKKTVSVEG